MIKEKIYVALSKENSPKEKDVILTILQHNFFLTVNGNFRRSFECVLPLERHNYDKVSIVGNDYYSVYLINEKYLGIFIKNHVNFKKVRELVVNTDTTYEDIINKYYTVYYSSDDVDMDFYTCV